MGTVGTAELDAVLWRSLHYASAVFVCHYASAVFEGERVYAANIFNCAITPSG